MISFLYFSIKRAWQGFWRNALMSLAATATMVLMLLLLAGFWIIQTGLLAGLEFTEQKVEVVAYLQPNATESQIEGLAAEIEASDDVSRRIVTRDAPWSGSARRWRRGPHRPEPAARQHPLLEHRGQAQRPERARGVVTPSPRPRAPIVRNVITSRTCSTAAHCHRIRPGGNEPAHRGRADVLSSSSKQSPGASSTGPEIESCAGRGSARYPGRSVRGRVRRVLAP